MQEILRPASFVFVPIYFLLIGMQIKLELFYDKHVLMVSLGITLAAILGKQVCGLCALEKGLNRIAIGVAMIPRGEVTLIFAGIGKSIGVISDTIFSALIIMVIITIMMNNSNNNYYYNKRYYCSDCYRPPYSTSHNYKITKNYI